MRDPWIIGDKAARFFRDAGCFVLGVVVTMLLVGILKSCARNMAIGGQQATVGGDVAHERTGAPSPQCCSAPTSSPSGGALPRGNGHPPTLGTTSASPLLSLIKDDYPDWDKTLDYIWLKESRRGKDPKCRKVGAAGERGEFQITPIFIDDIERLTEVRIDPHDNKQCRWAVVLWLDHYAPIVGAQTVDELYELYRYGPFGYRKLKGMRNGMVENRRREWANRVCVTERAPW